MTVKHVKMSIYGATIRYAGQLRFISLSVHWSFVMSLRETAFFVAVFSDICFFSPLLRFYLYASYDSSEFAAALMYLIASANSSAFASSRAIAADLREA